MKKIGVIILSFVIMIAACLPASATTYAEKNITLEKQALRDAHYDPSAKEKLTEKNITLEERNSKVSDLLIQLTAYETSEAQRENIIGELESLGSYVLPSSILSFSNTSTRSTPDFTWRGVITTYDNIDDTWLLSAGGNWNNNAWLADCTFADVTLGTTLPVGGLDGVGIKLYNTWGTYAPTTLEDAYAYVADGNGRSNMLYSRDAGVNPSNGVFFVFQDSAKCTSVVPLAFSYLGNNFSVFARYSETFENYHGYAAINYAHTWNDTTISSISITVSASPEFTVIFSKDSSKYVVAPNYETTF